MNQLTAIAGLSRTAEQGNVSLPDFGVPDAVPAIPAATYDARAERLLARAQTDWVVVYADREHVANMLHLTGIEPRFEEALLVLGQDGARVLLVGNETIDYAVLAGLSNLDLQLSQSLSLMGQDRSLTPSLSAVLADVGLKKGQTVGLVGWKYAMPGEDGGFVFPYNMVRSLVQAVGGDESRLSDVTALLVHPETGDRAVNDADQIAVFEWASARASAAVFRIVTGARPGMSEFEAAGLMGYQGEPLSCHMMMNSADGDGRMIGLRSPTAAKIRAGSGVSTAVGYWGALSSRAGMISDAESSDGYIDACRTYFSSLLAWYDTVKIGVRGGDIHDAVTQALAAGNLRPALNPGHLLGYDEWPHSPIRPGSDDVVRSGMAFQVDIIPGPLKPGQALNCEDSVVIADADLRAEIARRHPEVHARIAARRAFIRHQIGCDMSEDILPLSNIPLWLPPDWSHPDRVLTAKP